MAVAYLCCISSSFTIYNCCRANSKMFSHFSRCAIGSVVILPPATIVTTSIFRFICVKLQMKNHIKIVHLLLHLYCMLVVIIFLFFYFFLLFVRPASVYNAQVSRVVRSSFISACDWSASAPPVTADCMCLCSYVCLSQIRLCPNDTASFSGCCYFTTTRIFRFFSSDCSISLLIFSTTSFRFLPSLWF